MSATYNLSHYKAISQAESKHFWFRARNNMITALVNTFVPKHERKSFLEVGCGTGILLDTIKMLGFEVTGLDVNQTALDYAKCKHTGAHLIRQSLYSFTSPSRFRNIGAFDVLEHQTRDQLFLNRCYELLDDGGNLFLTVPAGMWLWSVLDASAGHKRRYDRDDLFNKLHKAGFTIQFSNYWNVLTFPLYVLFRKYATHQKSVSSIDLYLRVPNIIVNSFLYYLLRLEQLFLITHHFPWGTSLVVYAKKLT